MEEIVQDLCAGVVLVEADLEVIRDVHPIEFDDTGFGFAEDEDWRDILSSARRSSVECGLDLSEQRGKRTTIRFPVEDEDRQYDDIT